MVFSLPACPYDEGFLLKYCEAMFIGLETFVPWVAVLGV
jgi:hypothetical protein